MRIFLALSIFTLLSGCGSLGVALYEGSIDNNTEACTLTHPNRVGGC